jgi:hypothetical protein
MKIYSPQLKGTTTVASGSIASITGSFTGSIAGIDINLTNEFTASTKNRLTTIENVTASYETKGSGIVSGSSQITISSTTGYTDFSGSVATSISASVAGATWVNINGKPAGIVSGSSQVIEIISPLNTYTSSVKNAINVIGEGTSSVTTIYGNLVVEGTTITVSASNLAIADNMIYLNDGNTITDPDLGIAGNYNDGVYQHAGIFSDASDSHTWKVYKGYTPEPSQSIDITHGSFTLADFQAATLKGSISATNGVVSGSSQITYANISSIPVGIVSGSSQVIGILSSLNTYTGSNDTKWSTLLNVTSSLIAKTGSLATTGSNTFVANQIISGNVVITGSLSIGASWVGGTNVTAGYYQDNINAAYRSIVTSGNSAYYFQTNAGNASYMYIGLVGTYAGRIGIGTNQVTPNATLDVNGNAIVSGSMTVISNGGINPVIAIRQTNDLNQGYDFETEDVSVGRLDLYGKTSGGRVQMMTWIKANGRVGMGTVAPVCALDISSKTDAIALPKGTTGQRPSAATGMIRYNTSNSKPEYYNGSIWVTLGASGDGSSYSNAASSAKSIKAIVGNPSSGVYWLQVANVNSGNPFQCYCDFTMDGGIGYAIIFNQYFTGPETGPSHASFGSSTITTAGFDSEYQINPTAMISNYGLTKLAVFARTGGVASGGITGASYFNWVAFTGPTTTQYNLIFTNGYNSNQFTGTFNSSDGNTGTAYFPNSHGNTGGVTQITNGTTVNDFILYEYKQGDGTDPNHFWMVGNGRSGDVYWVTNNRYGSSSGNVMYNRWGGVALY